MKFFKTPKGLFLIVLVVLLAIAVPHEGARQVLPGLLAASAAAMLVDLPLLRWRARGHAWAFPSGALLTALLVAMVLGSDEPWHVVTITAVAGVVSKYLLRTRAANIFNPAALAIVLSSFVFETTQSWWGALPELPMPWLVVLFATGIYITHRVNKMPMMLMFLGAYFLLFTTTAFVRDPKPVAEIFRTPDLQAVLFFAFFMLTDPPTSPTKYRDQLICGAIVAVASYAVFELVGAVYYLLAGVLVGNLWETQRRLRAHRAAERLRASRHHAELRAT